MVGPLALPILPSRSFALKGAVVGLAYPLVLLIWFRGGFDDNPFLYIGSWIAAPVLSSYLLLQFTGSTAVTGMSGVKKELRIALPVYRVSAGLCGILVILAFLRRWMII